MKIPRLQTLKRSKRVDFQSTALAILLCVSMVAAPLATVAPGASPVGTAAAAPGEVAWTYSANGYVQSSPSIADGTVYFGDDGSGFEDGNMHAVDAETGAEVWSFNLGGTIEAGPYIVNGTVYVGSADRKMYALDADTGDQIWSFSTGDYIYAGPTVVDGTVYFGSHDNTVYAVDAETGTEEWSSSVGGRVNSAPTVVDGTVYIGSTDENLHALDASTGSEEWTYSTGGWVDSSPTVASGTVYVGSNGGSVHAVDAETGTAEWTFSAGGGVSSSPTVASGTVYVGDNGNTLHALDASTGEQVWSYSTSGNVESSPTVASGTVYVGSAGGSFHAVDAGSGTKKWSYAAGTVYSSPTIVEGTVYVGSNDNNLYALETDHTASSSGSRVELGTLGMTTFQPEKAGSSQSTQSSQPPGREFAWELDDETERGLYSDDPELLLERPDGSTDIAEFNHNDRAFHRVENGTTYDLRVMSDTAVYDFKSYTVQEILNYGILRIPSFNESTNGTATPVPTASVGDLKAQIRKLQGQVDGISVSVGSPEPIERINYTIRDDDGEPVYNGSEEFDEPTEHYQVVVGDNATANDSEAAGDDTITVSGNETDPLTDRVDEPSLEYSGQYANGTLFEGSTDFDGILGNDSGSIGFGPTGGSGGGGGGSPIVGVALVGGVGYAAYRVTGNGKGIRQAARKVVGRFR